MNAMPLLLKTALLGIAASLFALVMATFASTNGVRVNTEAWPPAAKAVLIERLGEPLSKDQWARIKRALQEHGGDSSPSHITAAEVRKVWPLVTVVALLALGLAYWRWRPLTFGAAALVVGPTALLLVGAFTHSHPFIK